MYRFHGFILSPFNPMKFMEFIFMVIKEPQNENIDNQKFLALWYGTNYWLLYNIDTCISGSKLTV